MHLWGSQTANWQLSSGRLHGEILLFSAFPNCRAVLLWDFGIFCSFYGCSFQILTAQRCSPSLAESFSFLHPIAAGFSELRVSFWPGQVSVAVIQTITLCGCVSWVSGLFQRSAPFFICCTITDCSAGATLQGCKNSKLPLLPVGMAK